MTTTNAPVEQQAAAEFPLPDLQLEPLQPVTPLQKSMQVRQALQKYGYEGIGVAGYLTFQNYVKDMVFSNDKQLLVQPAVAYWILV